VRTAKLVVFRWVDGTALAKHNLEIRKGKIQEVRARWGLYTSDVYVFRVCGRRTKEGVERMPVKCNQELITTGGKRFEMGDRIQEKKEVLVHTEDEEIKVFRLWLAHI
jgi:hypothetical protein